MSRAADQHLIPALGISNTHLLPERIQQTHFCEDDAPPTVYFGVILRRHAADGGQEELVKERRSHIPYRGWSYGKSLTAEDIALEQEGKMRCGVVEMSRLLVTVKGWETCFRALKLMGRQLGTSLNILIERGEMGFW